MTPLSTVAVPGAHIGVVLGIEGRPSYVAVFEAPKIAETLASYEVMQRLSESDRHRLEMNVEHQRALLALTMKGPGMTGTDWVWTAAAGFLWCALNHPTDGSGMRERMADMLGKVGRTTVHLGVGPERTVAFGLSDAPFPSTDPELPNHVVGRPSHGGH